MKTGFKPATMEAFDLLMKGSLAMARIERAGLRVDIAYLDKAIGRVQKLIKEKEKIILHSKEFRLWQRHYGANTKLQAPIQLGKVVFDLLGHERNPHLLPKDNSEAAFEHLKLPFKDEIFGVKKLKKALITNLYGIKNKVVDGYVHPFFDVSTAESYRGSSSLPNFQNQPIRNKLIAEIVRSCIIPRKGHVLLEADYSTQEVRVSYCYNKDPRLKHDILNGDMHKDRARELFLLSEEELGPITEHPGKTIRYVAKNMYVFPQFYGSYYAQCAPNLWDAIGRLKLCRSDGTTLYEHLKSKKIKELGACDPSEKPRKGTFELHVKRVEQHTWREVYTVYDQWKRDWWDLYQRQGGINTLTGFRLEGHFRRNQVLCDPIQGTAFHCLLWSIIEIQKEMIRRKMRSKIVCQIHDSALIDTHKDEIQDVIELFLEIAIKKVAEHWRWIICPLSVEFEIAEENWYSKQPFPMAGL